MKRKRPAYTPSFPAFQSPPKTSVSAQGANPAAKMDFSGGLPLNDERTPRLAIPSGRLTEIYKGFMRSALWRAKRTPILRRANSHCERCGSPQKALQVHHLNYERFLGRELPSDLEALCSPCHAIADKERAQEKLDALAVIAEEAEKLKEDRGFDTWMRKKYGEFWWRHLDKFTTDYERGLFEQWCEKKEANEL